MFKQNDKMRVNEWETRAYFAVYIAYLLYGLLRLLSVRENILDIADIEFEDSFFGSRRDNSNDEVENFNSYMQAWWMWYIVHVLISLFFKHFIPHRRSLGHAISCFLALLSTVKVVFTAILVCQLLTYYALSLKPSKRLTWALAVVWMTVINLIKNSPTWYLYLGYTEYYTIILTLSWSLLRCCSFVLSKLNEGAGDDRRKEEMYSLENFFGYTLYFPCMVHGPLLSYKRYIVDGGSNTTNMPKGTTLKLRTLGFELLRVTFWWLVMYIALHFLYIHYMARDVAAVKLVTPTFSRHAIGYFMGQFFFLYYVVTYGLGIAFAKFDDLNPPSRPRCVGCIHSYADMWKYFDEGLYEFLFRHIYAEICSKDSPKLLKLLATAATFAFVFIWHGFYTYILIWSILNFSCLVAEKTFKAFVATEAYKNWTSKYLSERNAQRLYAFLATQLFLPAALSNVYFISGMDVGNYFMSGAYQSGVGNFLILTFCSYCFFQCAEVILNRRKVVSQSEKR